MSENLTLILLRNVQSPAFESVITPMLLLLISVIAPVVESDSIGMFIFLKKVSDMILPAKSLAVPSPAAAVACMGYVRSIKVRNLDLFARLLKLW